VAEQVAETVLAAQALQHGHRRAHAHQQRQTEPGQVALQLSHAGKQKAHMARIALGAAQPLRLDHHQAERALEAHGLGQRRMVAHTQVALEPDQRPSARRIVSDLWHGREPGTG
jgi:hypothetical protein